MIFTDIKERLASFYVINSSLIKETVYYGFSKGIPGLFMFLSVFLFIRYAGVEVYGKFALFFSIAGVCGAILAGWIQQSQLRFYSKYTSHLSLYRDSLRKIIVYITVIIAVITILVFISISLYRGEAIPVGKFTIGLLTIGLIYHSIKLSTLQAQLKPQKVLIIEVVRSFLFLSFPLLLLFTVSKSYLSLVIGVGLAYIVSALLIDPWKYEKFIDNKSEKKWFHILKTFWRFGWPLSLWLAFNLMFQVSDRYLIQHYYSFKETGIYSGIYEIIVRSYSLLFFPITKAIHPRIMTHWNKGESQDSFRILKDAIISQVVLFIPVVLVLFFFGKPILSIVLPEIAKPISVTFLLLLASGGFVWQLALLVHKPLEMANKTKIILLLIIIAWVIDVFLSVVFLPVYGIIVSAALYLFSGLFYLISCMTYYIKLRRYE